MSNDVKIITLSNYERPKLIENKSKGYVLNGNDNSFYQYLIDRKNGSPTHSTILNSFDSLVYGKGIASKSSNLSDFVLFKSILSKNDLRRIVSDFNLFGEACFQVVKNRKNGLASIYHLPKQCVVPSLENEDGEIESYWYSKDWSNINKNAPIEFSAFGTSNDAIEIYCIKPYSAGKNYFSDPEYFSGVSYMYAEEEIANLYLNSIRNGLSAGYIINVPFGDNWTTEQKDNFERKIKAKLTGSNNTSNFVLSFNGSEIKIDVTPFPVNDNIHKQWEYLTSESRQQIFTAHGITSPILFGVKDNTGFGNNADEMVTAKEMLMELKINPKRGYILEAIDDVLNFYKINLDLYFQDSKVQSQSTDITLSDEKKKTDLDLFIDLGENEEIEGYELESVEAVDYNEEIELATQTGIARSNAKSKFDTEFKLVRYRYAGNPTPEREFCQRMMRANKIYRREDIEEMGKLNVNPGFGQHPTPNKPYSIWKYKGGGLLSASHVGGTCKHYWEKLTYKKKDVKIDVKSPISIDKASIDKANGIAGLTPHSR